MLSAGNLGTQRAEHGNGKRRTSSSEMMLVVRMEEHTGDFEEREVESKRTKPGIEVRAGEKQECY